MYYFGGAGITESDVGASAMIFTELGLVAPALLLTRSCHALLNKVQLTVALTVSCSSVENMLLLQVLNKGIGDISKMKYFGPVESILCLLLLYSDAPFTELLFFFYVDNSMHVRYIKKLTSQLVCNIFRRRFVRINIS